MFIDALRRAVSSSCKTAAACILVAFTCDTGNSAHARSRMAKWCAWDPGIDGFNCSFYTHQQCMENAWGNGGLCVPSPRGYVNVPQRRRFR
jgi:hypothetical protein